MLYCLKRVKKHLWLVVAIVLTFVLFRYVLQHKLNVSVLFLGQDVPTTDYTTQDFQNTRETKVYHWHDGKWRRIPAFCSNTEKFESARLRSPAGTVKMYIHSVARDNHISKALKTSGIWESVGINVMISHLQMDPDAGVLDLGSHIGVYSVVAALMGRHVVAVDPLMENVLRLCKTTQDANMTDRVTILFTALSDKYEIVTFKRNWGNVGNTYIRKMTKQVTVDFKENFYDDFINTVRLDDILPFVNFSKVFIKLDVENYEYETLKEGRQLLHTKDVRAILMEWFQAKLSLSSDRIMKLLYSKHFRAVNPVTNKTLQPSRFQLWPHDIVWVKN